MEQLAGYYNTFLIKIWCDEAGGKLRGYIQHASTQQHAYFASSEEMNKFILNHLDSPDGEVNQELGDTGRNE